MFTSNRLVRALLDRPGPEDFQQTVRATPLAMALTVLVACLVIASSAAPGEAVFLSVWACCTIGLAGFAFQRAYAKRDVVFDRVSRRMVQQMILFQVALALPYVALAVRYLGQGSVAAGLNIIWVCNGMAAGSILLMNRTLGASAIYSSIVLVAPVIGLWVASHPLIGLVAVHALFTFVFLVFLGFHTAEVARDLDRSVSALTATVSELEVSRDANHRLATMDTVTGLLNRKAVLDRMKAAVDEPETPAFLVMLFDLDRFKTVNDTFGHAVGDRLIRVVGQRLHAVPDLTSTVGRLGGDEFAMIVEGDIPDDEAHSIAARILTTLNAPVDLDGHALHPEASVGIARFPDHGADSAELLLSADRALHHVKDSGRGVAQVFNAQLNARLHQHDALEDALRTALGRNEIALHYQPKYCLRRNTYVGAEALVRWFHNGASVPPDVFLTVAFERGLMPDLSQHLVEILSADIRRWKDLGLPFGKIALNVHPIELKSPTLLMRNLDRLEAYGLSAHDIALDITESGLVGRGTSASNLLLQDIAARGYDIALDNFGTGNVSLQQLHDLPITDIKIDKGFVDGLFDGTVDDTIVTAIAELARGMSARTVAEGIETHDQRRKLLDLGIDVGQGHLWGKAMSRDAFLDLLQSETGMTPARRA